MNDALTPENVVLGKGGRFLEDAAFLGKALANWGAILADKSAAEKAEAYVQLRGFLDALSGAIKPAAEVLARLKDTVIPEAFEREGLSTITLKSGFRVTISQVVRASVREGMREAAFQWLKEHGRDSLITETINSSTLSAAVKHDLEAGMDWSDKIFNVHVLPQVSVTKTKS